MGAKTSTPATSGHQSPRSRTFSSSSTSATDIVPPGVEATNHGLNLLRTLPGLHVQQQQAHQHQQQQQLQQQQQHGQQQHTLTSTIDRQRARSLSSVPDIHQQQGSQQPHSSSHACSPGSANVAQNHLTRNINHFALGANNNNNNNNNQAHHHSQIAATYSSPAGSSNGSNNLMQHRHALNDVSAMVAGGGFMESIALSAATSSANGIGRVYTATSLPSHIWSFNVLPPSCYAQLFY